ncbi:MAG TPA: metal ABC transporter permease [Acidocella sp.]|jgi:zinc/manganese transport system permease protein|uniref:metal ABC transporter permease n=1 Tax=Acidocella sp. TaxID=50710 RepID=UPI002C524B66|nr:metal ABC transporter permease [Acidocella sp.]HVE22729.1 metal ABC transporter permease [Acidocella sp.]
MFSSFMVNAWIVGSIVAIVAGCVGFFVVLRGSSFAAHSLPLGAFPGAAAATLLGVNQIFGLIAFAALGVIGISQLSRRGRHEVATALSLVTLLGLGTLLLSRTTEYSQEVFGLLFGEVLGISTSAVLPVAALGAVSIAAILLLFRPLLLNALSPDLGEARGVRAGGIEFLFLAVLALATAMALPVVGALLVFSLMIGPASAARSFVDRPLPALFCAVAISLATVWAAIALAYVTDWPVGFFVGLFGAISYGLGRLRAWGRVAPRVRLAKA